MEDAIKTGFSDKTGRTIYVGDIVQYRLGKFGKSGGAENYKVIRFGKKYTLVRDPHNNPSQGGVPLTEKLCKNIVVIRSDYIRG